MAANRRFAKALEFGAAWTWSKAMDFNDYDTDYVSSLVPVRIWNYGQAGFDRTHIFKLNWMWDLPSLPWRKGPLHKVLNDWQLSGITSFISGAPLGVSYTLSPTRDITGTPDQGARVVLLGNPVLPKGERTFDRNFRTEVFAPPAVGTIGNAARTIMRGPGINNWDISISKRVPVSGEQRYFQFRAEFYSAFNHTQFSGIDTGARFNPAGQQINANFGTYNGARDPRRIQLSLLFMF